MGADWVCALNNYFRRTKIVRAEVDFLNHSLLFGFGALIEDSFASIGGASTTEEAAVEFVDGLVLLEAGEELLGLLVREE